MKPNVLFIFSDQHRAQALRCYGDRNIDTPNLDRLAKEGIRFERAFSNTPLCSPFRATLFTGQYATTHGVTSLHIPLRHTQKTLAQEMKEQGYYTCYMGKWHLAGGAAPMHFVSPYFRAGWDEWLGWENSNQPWETHYSTGDIPNPSLVLKGYQTDALTDLLVEWLNKRPQDRPWFTVFSVEPPHPPNAAPEPYIDMFKDKELQLRPNFGTAHPEAKKYEELLRRYYAQIANLDFNVGRIIKVLEDSGQLDDTVIVYLSDHGDMMGSHGKLHKSVPELESSQIPLIIRYPARIPAGVSTKALISGVDIMPSLLGLLNIPIPEYAEGTDISRVITGSEDRGCDCVLLQYETTFLHPEPEKTFRSLVRGKLQYTVYLLQGPCQLYNMEEDPYQMDNLIDRPDYRDTAADMQKHLEQKLESICDNFMDRCREYGIFAPVQNE